MHWRRSVGWRPRDLAWRIALLFMVGASLFALGSFPFYSQNLAPGVVGITFVLGSVCFTAAAAGQFQQVASTPLASGAGPRVGRYSPLQLGRIAWWAAVIQLVGTVLFNVNTVDAMIQGLTAEQANRLVWAPDLFGSIAFLVASHLGWLDVCGRFWCRRADDPDWWSAGANYVGSIFFMLAALAAFTLPTTDELRNTTLVNSATCAGALCFLGGAYLLLPRKVLTG